MTSKERQGKKPDWVPKNPDKHFTTSIITGVDKNTKDNGRIEKLKSIKKPMKSSTNELLQGVLNSDRTVLSKAITLIESNSPKDFAQAQELVRQLMPYSGKSVRIGITGVPGAGKSTFIESLGSWLIEQGHRVAVLAVDPSSTISKGSILGDKTRMEKLSRLDASFIRPSPSSGILGGVARKTRETIVACEAAGYDVILIETVGVGQSEVTVRSICDFFLLLQITGAGDDLQGIKKGIIELADLIAINKADGDNINKAESAKMEIIQVLRYLQPATKGWETTAVTCSALTGTNISNIWQIITDFILKTSESGEFIGRRNAQMLDWYRAMLSESILNLFNSDKGLSEEYQRLQNEILAGTITPVTAVGQLISLFKKSIALN